MQNRMRELREQNHLTQKEVSKILTCSKGAYVHYEKGRREAGYEALIKLSKLFRQSINYIIGDDLKEIDYVEHQ